MPLTWPALYRMISSWLRYDATQLYEWAPVSESARMNGRGPMVCFRLVLQVVHLNAGVHGLASFNLPLSSNRWSQAVSIGWCTLNLIAGQQQYVFDNRNGNSGTRTNLSCSE